MQRRHFLSLFSASLALSAGRVAASPYGDEVVSQLTRQGFTGISKETTWLGRERILAQRKDGQREIILNPRTGEILRDTWTTSNGAKTGRPIVDDVGETGSGADDGSESGSGSSGGTGSSGDDSGGDSSGDSSGDSGDSGSGGGNSDGNSGGEGSSGKGGDGKGEDD